MKNSEKYKKAAGLVNNPSSEMKILEYVEEHSMKKTGFNFRKIAAVCASLVIAMTLGITAYASDFIGIRHNIKTWLHGDLAEVTIKEVSEGNFEVTYSDGKTRSCGGMAYEGDEARGLTMDEMIEYLLTDIEAEQDEDGNYWLYIRDHKIDITDQINEKGYAQEMVKDGVLADYITVVWYGEDGCGIVSSHNDFPSPEEVENSTAVY